MNKDKFMEMFKEFGANETVAKAIFSERFHQSERIKKIYKEDNLYKHQNLEYFVFIDSYLTEAISIISKNPDPYASMNASENLRKICALVFESAELNDWLPTLNESLKDFYNDDFDKINTVMTLGYLKSLLIEGFGLFPNNHNESSLKKYSYVESILSLIAFVSLKSLENNHCHERSNIDHITEY